MALKILHRPSSLTRHEEFRIGANAWPATLVIAAKPCGLIVFADNSTDARHNERNLHFSKVLQSYGLGTLMCNLLTEQEAHERHQELSVQLFAARLIEVLAWIENQPELADMPLGLLGSSTGSAAALIVAAHEPGRVDALVSRAGWPDMAQAYLPLVRASTLLMVGSQDQDMLESNRSTLNVLLCKKRLDIIPNASAQFNEPGTLDIAAGLAGHWFEQHLTQRSAHGYWQ